VKASVEYFMYNGKSYAPGDVVEVDDEFAALYPWMLERIDQKLAVSRQARREALVSEPQPLAVYRIVDIPRTDRPPSNRFPRRSDRREANSVG